MPTGSTSIPKPGVAISAGRAAFGLAFLAAPGLAARLAHIPADQVTPATKLFLGMLGAREVAVAALTATSGGDEPERQRRVFQVGAGIDAADLVVCLGAAARFPSLRRGALGVVPFAIAGIACNLLAARAVAAAQ